MATPEQFIVDNAAEEWKALEYVREWCDISSAIDIATGHFEIGALLALDGAWQKVDRIRLLIGGETSRTTADAIAAALDTSILVERQTGDAFLTGVEAVVDGIRTGKIEIRVYKPKKFHAKAYITHSKLKVVGSAALVGSSNFTRPGLTQNVELNVRFQGPEVADLQEWYEQHWDEATPVDPELLAVLEHNVREFTPFEVYAKALHALTANVDPTDKTWEETESVIARSNQPSSQGSLKARSGDAQITNEEKPWLIRGVCRRRAQGRQGNRSSVCEILSAHGSRPYSSTTGELCSKGYSRMNEFEAHESSYDHQHKKVAFPSPPPNPRL